MNRTRLMKRLRPTQIQTLDFTRSHAHCSPGAGQCGISVQIYVFCLAALTLKRLFIGVYGRVKTLKRGEVNNNLRTRFCFIFFSNITRY